MLNLLLSGAEKAYEYYSENAALKAQVKKLAWELAVANEASKALRDELARVRTDLGITLDAYHKLQREVLPVPEKWGIYNLNLESFIGVWDDNHEFEVTQTTREKAQVEASKLNNAGWTNCKYEARPIC